MAEAPDDLQDLLTYLRDSRGFDFTGYKRPSLERRLQRRMEAVGVSAYDEYRDRLEVEPGEFPELFNSILINVTAFFRDPEAWELIESKVVPDILEARRDQAPIRVWSAGCASGEETYSVAMLLAAALGEEAFVRRVKVYGTDVDDDALDHARAGVYDDGRLDAIPQRLRERFVQRVDGGWCFRKDLRRSVIFGRNNLVEDAPISRIDLLLCRNALIYFNSETQSHILRRMHFALRDTGYLFLGKSEMLLSRRELFQPVDLKRRVFTKVARPSGRRRLPLGLAVDPAAFDAGVAGGLAARALDAAPCPHLVVAPDRTLLLASESARRLLRVGAPDIGRPLQDLEVSYRPAELRHSLDVAFDERRAVSIGPVRHHHGGEDLQFEIAVAPILQGDGVAAAASIVFTDVTARRQVEEELERSRQELGTAYEELQSTVEELETTNEELQSTNEELETMNEELQSTNEELGTMNDELRQRSWDLREANAVMEAILRSKGVGIIVIDPERHVRVWNSHSEELWGLRADEVTGAEVYDLDIGLPLDRLRPTLEQALLDHGGQAMLELPATDRRGRAFRCKVTVISLAVNGGEAAAAIVLAERAPDGAAAS